ncbi:MAG: DMT family transporter [Paracraurococcus sp.]
MALVIRPWLRFLSATAPGKPAPVKSGGLPRGLDPAGRGRRRGHHPGGPADIDRRVLTAAAQAGDDRRDRGQRLAVGLYGMSRAMLGLPMGTVYAVRVGIGAFGIALWGMATEGDPASAAGIACLALILAGVAGLRLAGRYRRLKTLTRFRSSVAGRNPPVCLAVPHGGGARPGARTGQWTGPLP